MRWPWQRREVPQAEERTFGAAMAGVPFPWRGYWSESGETVTTESSAGLPAVGNGIRLIGGLIGTAHLSVFEGYKGDKRELPDSPQSALFRKPYPGVSQFAWRYDIAVSLETAENAFVRKIRTNRRKVVALDVIPPKYVNAFLGEDGEKTFRISTRDGWQTVPAEDIIHIRGHTIDGAPFGVSRFQQHRDPLGSMLAAQRFEGAYFRNDARPGLVVETAGAVTLEQAREWQDAWMASHGGPGNAGKPTVLGGGWKATTVPISLRDAQFIESRNLSVEDVGRIMDIEPLLLGSGTLEQQDDQAVDRFLAFQLPPRLTRITAALEADPELFPGDGPYPEFTANPLMFASPTTRAEVQHKEIQAGTLLPDEARAENGRPPLPDGVGRIPQVTPVGGAPNPKPMPGKSPDDTPEE